MKQKRIPSWYRLFAEKRIKKLETALILLDFADVSINSNRFNKAQKYLLRAKKHHLIGDYVMGAAKRRMVGYEIAEQVKGLISFRMRNKLANELFRSRCNIKPAIAKLQQENKNLDHEIAQNTEAIKFLSSCKG